MSTLRALACKALGLPTSASMDAMAGAVLATRGRVVGMADGSEIDRLKARLKEVVKERASLEGQTQPYAKKRRVELSRETVRLFEQLQKLTGRSAQEIMAEASG